MDTPVETPSINQSFHSIVATYLRFNTNPLRSAAVVQKEFDVLCATPGIKQVAFYNEHTLMLGTENIVIFDPETDTAREVGEFLIFIRRYYANPWWDVSFRFRNITYAIEDGYPHLHPHILRSEYPAIDIPTGELCISRGQYYIYQHIRRGEMHLVASLLLDILRTYQLLGPYQPLWHWPEYEQEGND